MDRPHIKAGLPADVDRMPVSQYFRFRSDAGVDGADADKDPGQEKHEFLSKLPANIRQSQHITVGTLNVEVGPYEAMGFVDAWCREKRSGIGSLKLTGCGSRAGSGD